MANLIRLHLIVIGQVQGVGFRYNTQKKAHEMGLKGWVRNLSDLTVEILAEGEEAALERFEAWARQGPLHSSVEKHRVLQREPISKLTYSRFEIRH